MASTAGCEENKCGWLAWGISPIAPPLPTEDHGAKNDIHNYFLISSPFLNTDCRYVSIQNHGVTV